MKRAARMLSVLFAVLLLSPLLAHAVGSILNPSFETAGAGGHPVANWTDTVDSAPASIARDTYFVTSGSFGFHYNRTISFSGARISSVQQDVNVTDVAFILVDYKVQMSTTGLGTVSLIMSGASTVSASQGNAGQTNGTLMLDVRGLTGVRTLNITLGDNGAATGNEADAGVDNVRLLTGAAINLTANNSVNGSSIANFCVQADGLPPITQTFSPPQWIWNSSLCTINPGWSGVTYSAGTCSLNFTGSGNVFSQNLSMESNWSNPEITQLVSFRIPGGNNNKFYPTTTCGSFAGTNKFNAEQNNATTFHLKADRGMFSSTGNYPFNTSVQANFTTNMTNNVSRACIGSDCTNWEPYSRDAGLEDCFGIGFEGGVGGGIFQIQGMNVSQNTFNYTSSGPDPAATICTTNGTVSYSLNAGSYNFSVYNLGNGTYFNRTISSVTVVSGTAQLLSVGTFQALLDMRALRLFLATLIQPFNATNSRVVNTTAAGQLYLPALVGNNSVRVDVPGNYSLNVTCAVVSALSTVGCNATGVYDSILKVNATDAVTGEPVSVFTVTAQNLTLGALSSSTTNGSAFLQVLQGFSYALSLNATGYLPASVSAPSNASANTVTFSLIPAHVLLISFFDAQSLAPILQNVTATITKGSQQFTNSSTSGSVVFSNLESGVWTLGISAASYGPRTFFFTVNDSSVQVFNVYLLNSSVGTTGQFIVKDADNGNPIPGVILSMAQMVLGNWVVIGQQEVDAFGNGYFLLQDGVQYKFSATSTGYSQNAGNFTYETANSPYTIIMSRTSGVNFTTYNSFSYGITPSQINLSLTNFTLTVTSPTGTLSWFSVEVFVNATRLNVSNVTGSPNGGTAVASLNLAPYNGQTITARYSIQTVVDPSPLVVQRTWRVLGQTPGNYTFTDFMEYYGAQSDPAQDRLSTTTRAILVTAVAAIGAVALGLAFGAFAGAAGAAVVVILAAIFAWLSPGVAVIVVAGIFGVGMLGARGGL